VVISLEIKVILGALIGFDYNKIAVRVNTQTAINYTLLWFVF